MSNRFSILNLFTATLFVAVLLFAHKLGMLMSMSTFFFWLVLIASIAILFFQKGPKLEASIASIALLISEFSTLGRSWARHDYDYWITTWNEIYPLATLSIWILFSGLAIKSRSEPNRTIGMLLLLFFFTPSVLLKLDYFERVFYTKYEFDLENAYYVFWRINNFVWGG